MRRSADILGWMALALVVGGWFAFLRPPVFGGGTELVVVRGDSMRPTFAPGDLVVTRTSDSYSNGQVIAFEVAGGQARVIHRIVAATPGGFATKGDNRTSTDPWTPKPSDVTGRAVLRVPAVGALFLFVTKSPLNIAAIAGFAAFLVVMWPDIRGAGRRLRLVKQIDRPAGVFDQSG